MGGVFNAWGRYPHFGSLTYGTTTSRVSLRGPPYAYGVAGTPHGEVRDNEGGREVHIYSRKGRQLDVTPPHQPMDVTCPFGSTSRCRCRSSFAIGITFWILGLAVKTTPFMVCKVMCIICKRPRLDGLRPTSDTFAVLLT